MLSDIPMSLLCIYLLAISMLYMSYQWVDIIYLLTITPCCFHTNGLLSSYLLGYIHVMVIIPISMFHIFVDYIHVVFIPIEDCFIYLLAISMLFSYQWVVSVYLLTISHGCTSYQWVVSYASVWLNIVMGAYQGTNQLFHRLSCCGWISMLFSHSNQLISFICWLTMTMLAPYRGPSAPVVSYI